mgnify:CR=1 FL=1
MKKEEARKARKEQEKDKLIDQIDEIVNKKEQAESKSITGMSTCVQYSGKCEIDEIK